MTSKRTPQARPKEMDFGLVQGCCFSMEGVLEDNPAVSMLGMILTNILCRFYVGDDPR